MGAFRCLVPVGSVIRGKCISDSSLLVHSNSKGRDVVWLLSYVVCLSIETHLLLNRQHPGRMLLLWLD